MAPRSARVFYIAPDRALVAVVDRPGSSIRSARRGACSVRPVADPAGARDYYAAAADGARFLLDSAFGDGSDSPITVVVNWPAENEVPAPRAPPYVE